MATATIGSIRERALNSATSTLCEMQEKSNPASVREEIDPAVAFLSIHCRDAIIDMLSSKFVPEITSVDGQVVSDSESKGYNRAIMEMIDFLGSK